MKLYTHPRCSTCQKAVTLLNSLGISYEAVDLTKTPPTKRDVKAMLRYQDGKFNKLFNTSGMKYRELRLAEKLPAMSDEEKLALLCGDGMLVKRPFLLAEEFGLLGFREPAWRSALTPAKR